MMKILVTGANGFIGRHVLYTLSKTPYHIVATSIGPELAVPKHGEVTYISCDLNEKQENYFEYFNRPDVLIHLAWQGLPNYNELFHFERNLFTNYVFIKNMIEHGLKDCAILGTCLEYGMQNGGLAEDINTMPTTPYGLAKDTLRKFLFELKKKKNFTLKWIRLFYVYGEGQSRHALLEQLKTALKNHESVFNMSGGEQLRDYLPVENAADYIVKIVLQNRVKGIINCCSGTPIVIRTLVENYLKEQHQHIRLNLGYYPYPDYEPMDFWGERIKLQEILREYE